MSEPGSYYIVIPAEVRHDSDIPEGAKLLYGDICGLANKHGYAWASDNHLADVAGKSARQVRTYLNALEKAGHVSREERDGGRRLYITRKKTSAPPEENFRQQAEENFLHTNTSLTNTSTTTTDLVSVESVAAYFEERGASKRCARNQAHAFVAYYSSPSRPTPTEDDFKRRAATWYGKADRAGEIDYAAEKKRFTLDEICIDATLMNYDVTRYRRGEDGYYYER